MMKNDTASYQKMVKAVTSLVLDHPFFGHLALRMPLVEDKTCETAWSDGKTIAYNPAYVRILTTDKLIGLMGHLVMHPACGHHVRRNNRNSQIWNMACDYSINWILLDAGLELPDGYLDDPALRGKTADEIYSRLMEDRGGKPTDAANTENRQSPEDGETVETPEADAKDGGAGNKNEDGEISDEKDQNTSSDTDAEKEDDQAEPLGDPGKSGEVRDASPHDDGGAGYGEEDDEESTRRINLAQAAAKARAVGDMPASLERLIEDILSPRLNWPQLLHRFIQAAARCDYSWSPPNRRYIHRGLYLPAMRGTDIPDAVVAVDTSGSISPGELDQFAAELSAILESAVQTVHILYCDTKVTRVETVHRGDLPLQISPEGGGGTDFAPAFQWVEEQGLSPLCLIYLTDMAVKHFPEEPSYPVLWAKIGEEALMPPFGVCFSI